ncbi:MFS general substrate transporter [Rhypophila sp. PSN 637]
MAFSNFLPRLFHESGLQSVYTTGLDAWLIILNRCCRMFAYGASSLILAMFFAELQISDSRIGLFMTLTLLGDVVLSLILTLIADKVGRRRTLFAGSALMIMSGVIFALCENYWVLLFAAIVGVISATGGDFGPFRAIEESTVSELTCRDTRNDVLVWYVTTASIGSAVGTEVAGRVIEWLTEVEDGWSLLDAYHAVFWLYALMGSVNMASVLFLSEKCELKGGNSTASTAVASSTSSVVDGATGAETAPLLNNTDTVAETTPKHVAKPALIKAPSSSCFLSTFKIISRETLSVIVLLWVLLMIDSLADGMASSSLTTYFISTKFPELPKSRLGDMVSTAYLFCSLGSPLAGPLARHIGLINTMVFTHIPSSAAVLLFPFPKTAGGTFGLLLLRMVLNNMDQAPRAALIAAVVKPEERTAVMGITALLRTLSGSVGPSITGLLAGGGRFGVAFVVAGALRLVYDCGLWAIFVNVRLHKHEMTQDMESDEAGENGAASEPSGQQQPEAAV